MQLLPTRDGETGYGSVQQALLNESGLDQSTAIANFGCHPLF